MRGRGMKLSMVAVWVMVMMSIAGYGILAAEEKNPLEPRVPPDKRAEVKQLTSPHLIRLKLLLKAKCCMRGKAPA